MLSSPATMAILQQPLVQQVNTGRRSGSSRWPASALAGRAALGAAAFALVIIGLGVQFARLHGQWPQNYEAPSVQDAASSSAPLLGQQRVQPVKLLYPVWWHAPFYTGTGAHHCLQHINTPRQHNNPQPTTNLCTLTSPRTPVLLCLVSAAPL